jgi:hypothetical protein
MADIFSHWYHLIENFQASAKEFYAAVEAALQRRQIPDLKTSRVDWREGGLLSAKREYLRIKRKELVFDICAAPFGTGFFFSWWLGELPSGFWALVSIIPFFGPLMELFLRRHTYYKADTALMFQESVRAAVNEVIDQMTSAKGIRALTDLEKKPILRELYRR